MSSNVSETFDSGTKCPVCEGRIVIVVERKPTRPTTQIPLGPMARHYYRTEVTSIHCSNSKCGLAFKTVPGKPKAGEEAVQKFNEKHNFGERPRRRQKL